MTVFNVAIIPIRDNSKRLKKKNFLKINDKMLFEIVLSITSKSNLFKKIILSSNNNLVQNFCDNKKIFFDKRPKELCKDDSTVVDVCKYLIKKYKLKKNNNICVIYPTAILLKPSTLIKSYKKFIKTNSDTLIGCSKLNYSPYKAIEKKGNFYRAVFPKKNLKKFHKDYFFSNGSFYWAKIYKFLKDLTFYSKKMTIYLLDNNEACDLDDKQDWNEIKKKIRK